ncbi:MAG: 5'-nucleotidase, lipoprotein e(P4) family [Cobetia sp.]|jgi:5'-nucleotidase (lipoprotein e(P4) family)|uniref:5'-nucleotidase, lipoprotein e(P4) family n=2 Tax=Cobetia TaxID=204286 RepID=UPI000C483BBA|nr:MULTISPECIES: 5'-nucleotidase, lipoprotein e(P4) family [unclassified Cobetia]MBK08614.1 5'-nucleotidase, lipoprotein e(P4) family [Cobetia sp.]BBO57650.1 5'-nucleotidase [Cobetia sp. AM6]HAR07518.1 5'-nucleotidase, lipoprotein e(P4) family [Cobetia sp.]HBJ26954.1 5'-nucleotidase, lipoprotein e(P4) family [Cobetia sp.]|tara:strand:- start:28334 stop:29218 length:885 start_codon:yes stop_codon:yes gene_type:complete
MRRAFSLTTSAALLLALAGCASSGTQTPTAPAPRPAPLQDAAAQAPLSDQAMLATLWIQRSAEFHALSLQAFNVAHDRLNLALARRHAQDKPLAVVVDVDDTVLDTTSYGGWALREGRTYDSQSWADWVDDAVSTASPGAVEFLNYAHASGVDVYYITNRKAAGKQATIANLAALGFPQANAEHVMPRTDSSDKTARRARVTQGHDIALLMGDNLGDFDQAFQQSTTRARNAEVARQADQFGRRFVLLPNPTYGEWEGVLYDGNWSASEREKRAMRDAALNAWQPESGTVSQGK